MRKTSGFTLTETMVSLFILSLIITAAVPWFGELLARSRTTSLANDLVASLTLARSVAVKQNRPVTLCHSLDKRHCDGRWQDGWIVFTDFDRDRVLDVADGDRIVVIQDDLARYLDIDWNAFRSDHYIQFDPQGFTYHHNGTFRLCPRTPDPSAARAIIINRTGRIRFSADRDGDGIHEDAGGKPLRCG